VSERKPVWFPAVELDDALAGHFDPVAMQSNAEAVNSVIDLATDSDGYDGLTAAHAVGLYEMRVKKLHAAYGSHLECVLDAIASWRRVHVCTGPPTERVDTTGRGTPPQDGPVVVSKEMCIAARHALMDRHGSKGDFPNETMKAALEAALACKGEK